jgi:CRP-like cAMP-binding protein
VRLFDATVCQVNGVFLASLDDDARTALSKLGRRKQVGAGTLLFLEGDLGGNVIIVHEGHVKVYATSADGSQHVLAVRGPGDVLGDLSAIDGRPRSASGMTVEPAEVQLVPRDDFLDFLAEHRGAALALLGVVVERMRDSDRLRVEFGALDTTARVAMRLVELAETVGEPTELGVRLTVPLTQDDLAGWVAASREAVARALASLRKRGLIKTARREITVLDLAGLREATE